MRRVPLKICSSMKEIFIWKARDAAQAGEEGMMARTEPATNRCRACGSEGRGVSRPAAEEGGVLRVTAGGMRVALCWRLRR